jgi:hypothetical protein
MAVRDAAFVASRLEVTHTTQMLFGSLPQSSKLTFFALQCDEVRPVCGNCRRLQFTCPFEQEDTTIAGQAYDGQDAIDPPVAKPFVESQDRRLLELKLMHAYATSTCQKITTQADTAGSRVLTIDVPRLALHSQALLNAMFSFTALHLAKLEPAKAPEYLAVHHSYYSAALRDHAREVADLSEDTHDAACMTSMFMRLIADVNRQQRPLSPYTPPIEWFKLSRGAMHVFCTARQWHDRDKSSASARLRDRMPFVFDHAAQFDPANQAPFPYLLDPVGNDSLESEVLPIRLAYEHVVSYLGGIWLTIGECERSETVRRLSLMPFLVDAPFADLLAVAQPRALAVIAHYFAILSRFGDIWWIGAAGEREVRALSANLPGEWQPKLQWAVSLVEEGLHASDHQA